MAWIAVGTTAAGMVGKYLSTGKKAKMNLNLPEFNYVPSQYDAPASGQLFSTLQDRVAGKNVGYSPEDIATMNDQAVDQSARASNDMLNRSMAGRQQTGGISAGGTNVAREKAYMYGGGLKANALRDIAVNNAVQKRQEINAAIPQEQTFLSGERQNAQWQAKAKYDAAMQNTMLMKEEADKVEAYNNARKDSQNSMIWDGVSGIGGGLSSGLGLTKSAGGFDIGKYLSGSSQMSNSSAGGNQIGQILAKLLGVKQINSGYGNANYSADDADIYGNL